MLASGLCLATEFSVFGPAHFPQCLCERSGTRFSDEGPVTQSNAPLQGDEAVLARTEKDPVENRQAVSRKTQLALAQHDSEVRVWRQHNSDTCQGTLYLLGLLLLDPS